MFTHKKSPFAPKQQTDFSYLKSVMVSLFLYQGGMSSVEIRAGLLARDSSSGRLPGLLTSDLNALCPRLQRRVRGGMAP